MEDLGSILIVDDNSNNLQVLMAILGQAGYQVRPALSGEIALRAVEVSLPDLILLDVRMPGMDGYETCKRLQSVERTRDIPVIFISAMQDTEDKVAGFSAGGVDYVAKPFQAEEVLARVHTHIQLHRIQRHLESMVLERTQQLARSEARYRVMFEDSPIAILVFDSDSREILAVNAAFTRYLGYSSQEAQGQALSLIAAPDQADGLKALAQALSEHSEEAHLQRLQFRHRDGAILETESVLQRLEYPGCRAQILMLQDITERRRAEERLQQATKEHQRQLERTTYYDGLTGLPNRLLFTERMRQGLDQAQRTGCWMVVCLLDLDAFKPLNESYGQTVGDHLLINLATCLRSCLSGGDTLARLGGDEFALLSLSIKSDDELQMFMEDVQQRLGEPFVSDVLTVTLSASIGVTVYPHDDAAPDTLLRHADQAMMAAKKNGKGRWERFDPVGDQQWRARQREIDAMRDGLGRNEFVLYYQPKVDLRHQRVIGAEALIRWRHPERGLLPPGAFLPAVENHPLIIDLGEWVIRTALRQMAQWRDAGLDLVVSVNIAPKHLAMPNFVDRLEQLLQAQAVVAGRLELEVLESSALDDVDAVERIIGACRAMGVGFSLDDFGTGYSSLTYLRRLSADTLKIDQSFIRNMLDNPQDQAIVAGVIGLAAAFHRTVIAEGVETPAHGQALLAMGCDLAQGYGIARPMPAEDLPGWAQNWSLPV